MVMNEAASAPVVSATSRETPTPLYSRFMGVPYSQKDGGPTNLTCTLLVPHNQALGKMKEGNTSPANPDATTPWAYFPTVPRHPYRLTPVFSTHPHLGYSLHIHTSVTPSTELGRGGDARSVWRRFHTRRQANFVFRRDRIRLERVPTSGRATRRRSGHGLSRPNVATHEREDGLACTPALDESRGAEAQ